MNHIECSARDPQDSLGTVCILWIHRWYLLSKSFEPMNMGVDLLSQMPSPREETEAEWFSETNNLNEGSTIDHSINSSCNYSSYFYHFMIKTMHFNPCASFSPCSGIAPALLPSLEEWRLDPKKTAEIISSVTRRRDQPPNRKPLVSALNKTVQYIANARRENCQLPMAITPK